MVNSLSKIIKKHLKKILLISMIILSLLHLQKFFLNSYILFKNDYETRLTQAYGYCGTYSYGFVRDAIKKKKLSKYNIKIKNFGNFPNIESVFFNPKKKYNLNYLIVLNLDKIKLNKEFPNHKILFKKNNCYLLKT